MRFILATALLCMAGVCAFAQSNQGTITGTISDPAGAVVPGAQLEVKNSATGVVYQGGTSGTGNYVFSVPAGIYEISVSAPGFKKVVQTNVQVVSATDTRKDVTLEVGAATEVVSVTDTTELGEIATLLETKRIKRVPVVKDGKLVGIISRANLVRALAAAGSQLTTDAAVDDRTIRQKLLAELQGQEWVHTWAADIIVRDRVVHIWVSDDRSPEERQALRVAAENVPGVGGVEEHLVPAPLIPPAF